MKLKKFYDLISRDSHITLTSRDKDTVFFDGIARDIPNEYDNSTVLDFCVSNEGDFLFEISAGKKGSNENVE